MLESTARVIQLPDPYEELNRLAETGHIGRPIDGGIAGYEARLQADLAGENTPILLPWTSLSFGVGDLWRGLMTILFGLPGHAKSWLLLNIRRIRFSA
jgi:hypothetical protein